MEHVHYLPWVGENYSQGINGKRVMVLGESHYCGKREDDVPQITNSVVNAYLDSRNEFDGWMNTFTKFIRAFSGEKISREDSASYWNSFLFYNYIQTPLDSPRVIPPINLYRGSEDAFFEVLEQYRPDLILVWGCRLYKNLPNYGNKGEDIQMSGRKPVSTWTYELRDGHKVNILRMRHPSGGYSTKYWNEVIWKFIVK